MTRLLGLWGYAGSGKDTAAAALVEDGWRRDAFADRLRAMLYALDPIVRYFDGEQDDIASLRTIVDCYGWDHAKRIHRDVRELLQRLGTEAGRQVLGENVWVDALFRELGWDDVVITDMRFPNEAEAIRAAGGITVAIYRPGCEPVNGHASETALADWPFDFTVHNTGDVDDLHEVIRAIACAFDSRAVPSVSIGHGAVPSVNRVEDPS